MTTLCGISGTNLCFSVSIVTISPVCDWYRFHICIIYLFVYNVNVIYGTGSIVECKKIKVIFMQLAQTRPFYYFSLLLDPVLPCLFPVYFTVFSFLTLFPGIISNPTICFFGTGSSLIILRRVSAPR